MDKRNSLHGSMNLPTPKPGNTSNDTTLSDSRMGFKETSIKSQEEYNIRNMFKDSGATNGKVPNVGKRKKSVTLLGFYKTSSPVETKAGPEVFVEDKEGSTTADQLSISLEECLSSVPVSPTDTEAAVDQNSNKGSGNKLDETFKETSPENQKSEDDETLSAKFQEKLSTRMAGIVDDSSKGCSRFSVVRTAEEAVVTPAADTDNRGESTAKQDDLKTDQISQKSIDSSK